MKRILFFSLLFILFGCSDLTKYDHEFDISGKIGYFDNNRTEIYIEGYPGVVNVDSANSLQGLKIGDEIKITLLAKNTDTCWCPDQWKIQQIKKIE